MPTIIIPYDKSPDITTKASFTNVEEVGKPAIAFSLLQHTIYIPQSLSDDARDFQSLPFDTGNEGLSLDDITKIIDDAGLKAANASLVDVLLENPFFGERVRSITGCDVLLILKTVWGATHLPQHPEFVVQLHWIGTSNRWYPIPLNKSDRMRYRFAVPVIGV